MLQGFFQALFAIWAVWLVLACIGATMQERKIWKNNKLPSVNLFGLAKIFILNVAWMGGTQLGVFLILLTCVLTLNFKDTRNLSHNIVERYVGQMVITFFVCQGVEIRGAEHLITEKEGPAPVLIANHDSQIDIAAVYFLKQQWRWIAKASVFFLPGVGQLMYLGGHVLIDRVKKNNESFTGARNLYTKSNASLQEGVPMFFFPQGTRRLGERLPFKDGAFKIATSNKSKIIPISIDIPLTAWNSLYPLSRNATKVILTVHPPIESAPYQGNLNELKSKCFETIYSVLPDHSKQD
jgi:1-acyl-sn-glycerol-3-phosphate acyltransferase